MSETQGYKISYSTLSIALRALYHHEGTVKDWLEMEPDERLRVHLRNELEQVRAAIKELLRAL